MGRGHRRPKKAVKKVEKKVKDPEERLRRRPWLRQEPEFFVPRFSWGAEKPNFTKAKEDLVLPVTKVVLNYHSRFPACTRLEQCKFIVRNMQRYQCQLLRYQDLAYNWYIGGDGHAYEGRGWKKHPKQQHELSSECLEIAYMGDFPLTYDPPEKMVKIFHEVVKYGIEKAFISPDYELHEFRLPPRPSQQSFKIQTNH